MHPVEEFGYKMALALTAKAIEASGTADGNPDAIDRVDFRGRACAYSHAAVMVLEMIDAEEAK